MTRLFRPSVTLFFGLHLAFFTPALGQDGEPTDTRVTHGPMLGRPSADSMSLWLRTARPGRVVVFYGTDKNDLSKTATLKSTSIDRDNTGILTLTGLQPNTRYHYRIADHQLSGSFRTLPRSADFRNASGNPEGLFNFRFEFACGNNQRGGGDSAGPTLPVFDTLNAQVRDKVNFAILNGDWLYENRRDYPASEWLHQVGLGSLGQAPDIVQKTPTVVGVWDNYKTYLERGRNLSEWHRHVPSFYTADDHELLNDIYGTGEVGYVNRRAVFRDIATRAWFDYLAWANPVEHDAPAWFGVGTFKAGSDVLADSSADFTKLDLNALANLHVHWGTSTAGLKDAKLDAESGDPNSAVYEIVEVLGPHRLRINPPAKANGSQTYSIGRRCYGKFSVSNCDFFLLDTRSHRSLHNVDHPANPASDEWHETAGVRDDQFQVGVFLEQATHHHAHRGQGGVEHECHAGDQGPVVDAVHVDGRCWVHVHGNTQALDVLVDRPEFLAVECLLVDVGEEVNAFESQLFYAAVDLGDGAVGAAPAQCGPGLELAGVALDDLGQVVVYPGSPVIGLGSAQQLGARHAVAEDGHANTKIFHVLQLLVDFGVD